MRLFADENMARAIVVRLRALGHDVLYASELDPGAADSEWLTKAEADGRIILTADKDFGDLVFRDRMTSHGVVLFRLDELPLAARLARVERAWASIEAHPSGRLIVITPSKVRIRKLISDDS